MSSRKKKKNRKKLIIGLLIILLITTISINSFAYGGNKIEVGEIIKDDVVKLSLTMDDTGAATMELYDGATWYLDRLTIANLKKMIAVNMAMFNAVEENNYKIEYSRKTDLFVIKGGVVATSYFSTHKDGTSFTSIRFLSQLTWDESKITFNKDELQQFLDLLNKTIEANKDISSIISSLNSVLEKNKRSY